MFSADANTQRALTLNIEGKKRQQDNESVDCTLHISVIRCKHYGMTNDNELGMFDIKNAKKHPQENTEGEIST